MELFILLSSLAFPLSKIEAKSEMSDVMIATTTPARAIIKFLLSIKVDSVLYLFFTNVLSPSVGCRVIGQNVLMG